jgi:hypothetical protein
VAWREGREGGGISDVKEESFFFFEKRKEENGWAVWVAMFLLLGPKELKAISQYSD